MKKLIFIFLLPLFFLAGCFPESNRAKLETGESWVLQNPEETGNFNYHSILTFHKDGVVINECGYTNRSNSNQTIKGCYSVYNDEVEIIIGGNSYNMRISWQGTHQFKLSNGSRTFVYRLKADDDNSGIID